MRDSKRDTDVLNSLLHSVGEGEGRIICENGIGTCILYVKRFSSPGSIQDAWGLVHWMIQRDGMEREVGGGIGMGNTCKSMADSCQCMEKTLQYCKVISLQRIKINGKKKLNIQKTKIMASGLITS